MSTNATLTVGLATAPKRVITAQGVVIRYGYQPMGDTGYAKYMEHLFRRMPDKETLRSIVTSYNEANGINAVFDAAEYGL